MSFDQAFWEQRWAEAIAQQGEGLARRPPNQQLVDAVAHFAPGRALDAGCGHGAETSWLAARGWQVTGVDFSETALEVARSIAQTLDVADRIDWVRADLGAWTPEQHAFDLVVSLYVHIDGAVEQFVQRMGDGVAPGGSLFMIGHQGIEQNQVTVDGALAALDGWRVDIAEERPRANGGTDAVVLATRP